MTDIVDRKTRSKVMASIRGRDTAPEWTVRCIAHRMGLRFRLQCEEPKALPLPAPPLAVQRSFARIADSARNIGNLAAFEPCNAALSESIMSRLLGTEP